MRYVCVKIVDIYIYIYISIFLYIVKTIVTNISCSTINHAEILVVKTRRRELILLSFINENNRFYFIVREYSSSIPCIVQKYLNSI